MELSEGINYVGTVSCRFPLPMITYSRSMQMHFFPSVTYSLIIKKMLILAGYRIIRMKLEQELECNSVLSHCKIRQFKSISALTRYCHTFKYYFASIKIPCKICFSLSLQLSNVGNLFILL